jgi:tetratricopeptide (TPR) repeat protein
LRSKEVFLLRLLWILALLAVQPAIAHPDSSLRQPARRGSPGTLAQGLGNHHHAVSTNSALAQRFLDQGLTYVYAFNHQEAARSFRRAAEIDPKLAMAHWGLALALGPNYNAAELNAAQATEARAALVRAQALGANAPANEQAYIASLAVRFAEPLDPDPAKAAQNYRDAMRALMQRYPDDLDAATLFADSAMVLRPWRLWNRYGTPAEGTAEILIALESVLARDPNHIGANHFFIHAVEASPYPERALPSADRLLHFAPAAGHLVHMAAHVYDRVGDHAGSARANAAAIAADLAYFRQSTAPNPYQGYYAHNLHFLAIAHTAQGRYGDAIKAARRFGRQVASTIPDVPGVEGYLPAPTLINVRFQKWDEVLKLPRPPQAYAGPRAVWHFARGMAFAARGRIKQAESERAGFAKALAAMPADEAWGRNLAADVFSIAAAMLDGNLALAKGGRSTAITFFESGVAAEDALNYDEPIPWYLPLREPLGAALLAGDDAAAAEKVFVGELGKHPRSGRALYGLAAALKAQGKPAETVERDFSKAWENADTEPHLGVTGVRPFKR